MPDAFQLTMTRDTTLAECREALEKQGVPVEQTANVLAHCEWSADVHPSTLKPDRSNTDSADATHSDTHTVTLRLPRLTPSEPSEKLRNGQAFRELLPHQLRQEKAEQLTGPLKNDRYSVHVGNATDLFTLKKSLRESSNGEEVTLEQLNNEGFHAHADKAGEEGDIVFTRHSLYVEKKKDNAQELLNAVLRRTHFDDPESPNHINRVPDKDLETLRGLLRYEPTRTKRYCVITLPKKPAPSFLDFDTALEKKYGKSTSLETLAKEGYNVRAKMTSPWSDTITLTFKLGHSNSGYEKLTGHEGKLKRGMNVLRAATDPEAPNYDPHDGELLRMFALNQTGVRIEWPSTSLLTMTLLGDSNDLTPLRTASAHELEVTLKEIQDLKFLIDKGSHLDEFRATLKLYRRYCPDENPKDKIQLFVNDRGEFDKQRANEQISCAVADHMKKLDATSAQDSLTMHVAAVKGLVAAGASKNDVASYLLKCDLPEHDCLLLMKKHVKPDDKFVASKTTVGQKMTTQLNKLKQQTQEIEEKIEKLSVDERTLRTDREVFNRLSKKLEPPKPKRRAKATKWANRFRNKKADGDPLEVKVRTELLNHLRQIYEVAEDPTTEIDKRLERITSEKGALKRQGTQIASATTALEQRIACLEEIRNTVATAYDLNYTPDGITDAVRSTDDTGQAQVSAGTQQEQIAVNGVAIEPKPPIQDRPIFRLVQEFTDAKLIGKVLSEIEAEQILKNGTGLTATDKKHLMTCGERVDDEKISELRSLNEQICKLKSEIEDNKKRSSVVAAELMTLNQYKDIEGWYKLTHERLLPEDKETKGKELKEDGNRLENARKSREEQLEQLNKQFESQRAAYNSLAKAIYMATGGR